MLLLLTWSIPDLDRQSSFSDPDPQIALFWIPAGSSTPDLHRCRANTRKFYCLSQESWTTQSNTPTNYYIDKGYVLAGRQETLFDRIRVVKPRKVQGQEELVSQLPMNTQITEPLQEGDTPPPLTCKCLLWHRELRMEMRCQVRRISFFYEKVSVIYEVRVKAGLDDGVNYTEKALFTKNRCMFLKGNKYTLQGKKASVWWR